MSTEKPICQLIDMDGNVFSIISKVSKVLKTAGMEDQAKQFKDKARECGSYDEVLSLLHHYVDVR
jgi:hypothetical protein